jgi:mitochondrial import receptor subunit TOM40
MGGVASKDSGQKRIGSPLYSMNNTLFQTHLPRTLCDDSAPPPPPLAAPGTSDSVAAPPPPPDSPDSIAEAANLASAYSNPGPYEQAAADAKRLVTLDTFDGFRCDIQKQVSPFMLAIHSFWLGTSMIPDGRKSSYSFTTQVADDSGFLLARADPSRGSVDGRIHRALLGGIAMGKIQCGVSQDGQADQVLAEVDFGGHTWTGNLKYGSMGGGLVYGLNYYQAVTPRLAMGGEGMYISANQGLLSSYTLKYTMPAKTGEEGEPSPITKASQLPAGDFLGNSTMIVNYNAAQAACTLNYKRVITPNRVTVGGELQFSPFTFGSQLLLGAEFKLSRSKMCVSVDERGRLQTVLEAKLGFQPHSPTLQFSADVDHLNEEMKFGYGINIEG